MSTIQDAKFQALRNQGFVGAISDMTLQWLKANGAASGSTSDAWLEMMATQGFTGQRNDAWADLLESLGYVNNELGFWADGGSFSEGAPGWQTVPNITRTSVPTVIDMSVYSYGNPAITSYSTTQGTITNDGLLTINEVNGTYPTVVTATNALGFTASNSFDIVIAVNQAPTGLPVLFPQPTWEVGNAVLCFDGFISDPDGLTTPNFSYQWYSETTPVGLDDAIYELQPSDDGNRIRCQVDFTDDAGYAESLDSGFGDVVGAAPPVTTPVLIQQEHFIGGIATLTDTRTFAAQATAGNLLITAIGIDKGVGSITIPPGYTEIGTSKVTTDISGGFAYKIADGSETTVTWVWGASRNYMSWYAEISNLGVLDTFGEAQSPASNVNSQTTGLTGILAKQPAVAISMWGTDTANNSNTGQLVSNGSTTLHPFPSSSAAGLKIAYKQLNTLDAFEEIHTDTDTGDQMMGKVAVFPFTAEPPLHALTPNANPVRNIVDATFDLVVDSNIAGEQIYAAMFAAAADSEDPVTVKEGRNALWSGSQVSVVGENIFNVTGMFPTGRFYGFAQENWTPEELILNYTVETTDVFDFKDHQMIPARNNFCFQFVFDPGDTSANMPFETTVMQFASGSAASPTNRLSMYIWGDMFRIVLGGGSYNGSIWTFSNGQRQDVRVRVSDTDGLKAWVNGVVLLSVPAHTIGLDNDAVACKMPQFSGTDPMPFVMSKFRWVADALSDAEIGAWA